MSDIIVDDKGRITIPEDMRKKMQIRKGSKVKVSLKQNRTLAISTVDPKEFIDKLEGFIKKGSGVQKTDPLKLKEIWMANR